MRLILGALLFCCLVFRTAGDGEVSAQAFTPNEFRALYELMVQYKYGRAENCPLVIKYDAEPVEDGQDLLIRHRDMKIGNNKVENCTDVGAQRVTIPETLNGDRLVDFGNSINDNLDKRTVFEGLMRELAGRKWYVSIQDSSRTCGPDDRKWFQRSETFFYFDESETIRLTVVAKVTGGEPKILSLPLVGNIRYMIAVTSGTTCIYRVQTDVANVILGTARPSDSPSASPIPSQSSVSSPSASASVPIPSSSPSASSSAIESPLASTSASPSMSVSQTKSPSAVPSVSSTLSPPVTPSSTPSASIPSTTSATASASATSSASEVPVAPTLSSKPVASISSTPSASVPPPPIQSSTPSMSKSPTSLMTTSPTTSTSLPPTPSASVSSMPSTTPVQSSSPNPSPSMTPARSPSMTPARSPSMTPARSPSMTPARSPSMTPARSPSMTPARSPSMTPAQSPSMTQSLSPSVTPAFSPSMTPTRSPSTTPTRTQSGSPKPSLTPSQSLPPTRTPTPSSTPSSVSSSSPSSSPSSEAAPASQSPPSSPSSVPSSPSSTPSSEAAQASQSASSTPSEAGLASQAPQSPSNQPPPSQTTASPTPQTPLAIPTTIASALPSPSPSPTLSQGTEPVALGSSTPSVTPSTDLVPLGSATPSSSRSPPVFGIDPGNLGSEDRNTSTIDGTSTCFPGQATVVVEGVGAVRMAELEVGMRVWSGREYSKVVMFTHRNAVAHTRFREICTSETCVRLSGGHYMYANGRVVAGREVQVGDVVSAGVVVEVREVVDRGLYNPQTENGEVVVDGVRASCYTERIAVAEAHALLAPLRGLARVVPAVVGWVGGRVEAFAEHGVSGVVSG